MKEVQGELNSTAIVAISVGVLAAFFFSYLWPIIKLNFKSNTDCSRATCNCNNDSTKGDVGRTTVDGIEYCTCTAKDVSGSFKCIYKG